MHCDEFGCYEFCKSNIECYRGICCQEQDFGICKTDCDNEYIFSPQVESDFRSFAYEEQPAQINAVYTLFYLGLFALTVFIGGLYLFFRGKKIHIKV